MSSARGPYNIIGTAGIWSCSAREECCRIHRRRRRLRVRTPRRSCNYIQKINTRSACLGFCRAVGKKRCKNKLNSLASIPHGLIDKPLNRRRTRIIETTTTTTTTRRTVPNSISIMAKIKTKLFTPPVSSVRCVECRGARVPRKGSYSRAG